MLLVDDYILYGQHRDASLFTVSACSETIALALCQRLVKPTYPTSQHTFTIIVVQNNCT